MIIIYLDSTFWQLLNKYKCTSTSSWYLEWNKKKRKNPYKKLEKISKTIVYFAYKLSWQIIHPQYTESGSKKKSKQLLSLLPNTPMAYAPSVVSACIRSLPYIITFFFFLATFSIKIRMVVGTNMQIHLGRLSYNIFFHCCFSYFFHAEGLKVFRYYCQFIFFALFAFAYYLHIFRRSFFQLPLYIFSGK